MHYLECIALLNFLLKKFTAGQRTQVPLETCVDITRVLKQVEKKLANEKDYSIESRIRDLHSAVYTAQKTTTLLNLTDQMKVSMVKGITEVKDLIAIKAFKYFRYNEFEVTTETIPIMRSVVETALNNDLI